jgi:1,4-dihydroxy-2-naphthoate octaprenyltransferase
MTSQGLSKKKSYIAGTRLPFVSASVLPAVLAAVWCGVYGTEFIFLNVFLGVLGVFFLHLGANTLNDYFDWEESDRINRFATPFSGGSRSRLEHILSRRAFLHMSVVFFVMAAAAGAVLFFADRPHVVLIGTAGGLCGILYSLKPFSFQSRGLGELIIFFSFGPLITLGIGYVNFGVFSPEFFLLGVPNGCAVASILWINEFPDYEADRDAGKRNLVVRIGTGAARYGYAILMILFYLSALFLIIYDIYPRWSLLILLTVPVAIKTTLHMWKTHADPVAIISAQAGTIQFQMLSSVILIASFIMEKMV